MFAKRCKFRTVSTKSVHPFQPNRVFDESQPWIAGPDYSLSTTPSTCTATRNLITGPDYSLSATPSTCTATHSHPKPDYWPGLWLFSHSQHLHSNPFPTREKPDPSNTRFLLLLHSSFRHLNCGTVE